MLERTINKLGHRIGARGGRTRAAILDATRRLLERRHLGELRVADVAAEAGVSPSNFYTYFKTVEEPVLALCEAAAVDFQPLSRHLDGDWSAEQAFSAARAYVVDVLMIWRDHGPVLRIEHMLADKGEAGFVEARVRRLRRVHLSLERRIAVAHATGYHAPGLDPRLASYEVANLVESVAAGFELMRRGDTPSDAILDTTAHIVVKLVTGR
ncbi:TetR/AcrR family transcriptional regulator [Brevundimonas sp. AJA228-03]|uniref:TetR/AcrR family transcriptional regulator n=1 Tax=Brevundimonas sp. AJA228-03 TaxID=2752515 RepID=UPI001ADEF754|nr:TetR/AcrR family transcriptional regulator [Brevundimonas sp. AJA228-03]QTN18986.1 TetR/AcrR family transcriptional regulator [Brevundimonas sp. AJA228-03]